MLSDPVIEHGQPQWLGCVRKVYVDMGEVMQRVRELVKRRQLDDARRLCSRLVEGEPENVEGWLTLGRICQQQADFDGALENARHAKETAPGNFTARLQEVESLIHMGHIEEAQKCLIELEGLGPEDPRLQQHVGEFYTHAGLHEEAVRTYSKAYDLAPRDAGAAYNLAASYIATGDIVRAEELLDLVISLTPSDYDAYYNRATLRTQTQERNHRAELESLLASGIEQSHGRVQVLFALAKELEDLGESEQSFARLREGANLRKQVLSYRVEQDIETITAIRGAFDEEFFATGQDGCEQDDNIFVFGLPRSGTTLVDRIISSHSKVRSLGEISDFVLGLMSAVGTADSKTDLVAKSTRLDFRALGQSYADATRQRGGDAQYLIDKSPMNFLYVGLIAKALPQAKIIHLRRNPMDSCYAMYKTLFRMGYPFSYDLEDLAQYYIAYHGLMDHWRCLLPGRILDVDYEALVEDQEAVSRAMIAHCGLEWEDACLEFHKNTSAAATASAAQVRQPIYQSSVAKWRNYETELEPLRRALESHGIAVGGSQ